MKTTQNRHDSEMPYEKFIRQGGGALSEAELLAVILRTGTVNCPALALAEQVLSLSNGKERGLNAIHHLSLQELKSIPGIGEVKAVKIKCIAELATRMAQQKAKSSLRFDRPETVAAYFMEELRHEEKENVLLISLDNKLQLIEKYLLSVGTGNASILSPREVYLQALKNQAASIMILHNHPSGDPVPSKEDIMITNKIKEAGELIEIHLLDHIIIGDRCFVSFAQEGLLQKGVSTC